MVFVPFPGLAADDRVAHSEPIDAGRIQVSPAAALQHLPAASRLRLVQNAGGPVYLLDGDGPRVAVDAQSGQLRPLLSPQAALSIAQKFSKSTPGSVAGPLDYDQWIVHQQFDAARPFYRVALQDPAATTLYVSARSGEVLQRTTARERGWNWVGAVPHWWYYTIIRKDWAFWNFLVWWVALIGVVLAVAGAVLGVQHMLTQRRSRGGWSPFRGWLRWHHFAGLGGGLFLLLSITSGWLSMDHGRLFSTGVADSLRLQRYRGMSLHDAAASISVEALRSAATANELLISAVAGRPLLLAPADHTTRLTDEKLLAAVRAGWPDSHPGAPRRVAEFDLAAQAEGMPEPTVQIPLNDGSDTTLYVDSVSGQIVTVMDPSRLRYAWLYYAMHTYRYPGLITHPALRQTLIFVPLSLGFALSLTAVVVGLRRITRLHLWGTGKVGTDYL